MTDLALELSKAEDEDELLRLAVELGTERLGFDRMETRVFAAGEAAPVEEGQGEGRCPLRYYESADCLDAEGRKLGQADRAVALLWDGERDLGELYADNLSSGRPIDGGSLELLVLYARTVGNLLRKVRDEAELRLQASTDLLTGAMNRRVALMFLEKQVGLAARKGESLSAAYVDLDGLKSVNDSFGHAEGDAYISAISSILLGSLRATDCVGRLGGDEFLVVFPDCPKGNAEAVMRRITLQAADRAAAEGKGYPYSLSWGVASLDEVGREPARAAGVAHCASPSAAILVELADKRMYEDKLSRGTGRRC